MGLDEKRLFWAWTVRITWPTSSKKFPIEFCSYELIGEAISRPIREARAANSIGDKDVRNFDMFLISFFEKFELIVITSFKYIMK